MSVESQTTPPEKPTLEDQLRAKYVLLTKDEWAAYKRSAFLIVLAFGISSFSAAWISARTVVAGTAAAKATERIEAMEQKAHKASEEMQQILASVKDSILKRSISGHILDSGSPRAPTGFNASRTKKGEIRITFQSAFSDPPVFVASVSAKTQYTTGDGKHPADTIINVDVTSERAIVWTYEIDRDGKASPVDEAFSFVVVGK